MLPETRHLQPLALGSVAGMASVDSEAGTTSPAFVPGPPGCRVLKETQL